MKKVLKVDKGTEGYTKEFSEQAQLNQEVIKTLLSDEVKEVFIKTEGKSKLSGFKTCELVEELKTREGVEEVWTEPHENIEIPVNGPAIVLMVID